MKEAKTPGAMRVMYHHHCIVTEKSLAEEEMKVKDGISFQVSNVTTAMLVPDEGAMHPRLFQKHMLTNRDGWINCPIKNCSTRLDVYDFGEVCPACQEPFNV